MKSQVSFVGNDILQLVLVALDISTTASVIDVGDFACKEHPRWDEGGLRRRFFFLHRIALCIPRRSETRPGQLLLRRGSCFMALG